MCELEYLEAKIVEHCNYKCRVCNDYGNIAMKEEYEIEQFEKDVKRISELFDRVKMFHILGGEPLLSKNITKYIEIARNNFADTDIYLITNGTLLGKMDCSFFDTIRKNNIFIHISHYPEQKDLDKIELAEEILRKEAIRYQKVDTRMFSASIKFENNEFDPDETFAICNNYINCTNINNGRIYKCPRPFSLKHYDRMYDTNYSNIKDGLDIHQENLTGEQILDYLSKRIATCRYCTPVRGYVKWQQTGVSPYDWQCTQENNLLIDTNKNFEDLNSIFKDITTTVLAMNLQIRKVEVKEYDFNELKVFEGKEIYIWLHDLRCVSYYDLFTIVARKYNIKIAGMIPRLEKLGRVFYDTKVCTAQELVRAEHVFIFASGVKGRAKAIYEVSKILDKEEENVYGPK